MLNTSHLSDDYVSPDYTMHFDIPERGSAYSEEVEETSHKFSACCIQPLSSTITQACKEDCDEIFEYPHRNKYSARIEAGKTVATSSLYCSGKNSTASRRPRKIPYLCIQH